MQEATKTAPEASKASGNTKPQAAPEFKPTVPLDASAAIVMKSIVSIAGRGAKLGKDIHSTALACLYHVDKHGDYTLMNRLLLALPKSARRNALAQWAVKFGKLKKNEDKAAAKDAPLVFNREGKNDIAGATAMPFWEFKNVSEGTQDWDFGGYIANVTKTLQRHADAGNEDAKGMLAVINARHMGKHPGLAMPYGATVQ